MLSQKNAVKFIVALFLMGSVAVSYAETTPDVPGVTGTVEVETPDAVETPDVAEAPEAPEVAEVPEIAEIPEVAEVQGAPEIAETH